MPKKKRKSQTTAEIYAQVYNVVLRVESRLYKSSYEAAKKLGPSKIAVTRCAYRHANNNKFCYVHKKCFS